MNSVSKSILVTLILTVALSSAFSQKVIELSVVDDHDSNPNNDTFLIPPPLIELGNHLTDNEIAWQTSDPKIATFVIVQKLFDPTDPHPFRELLNRPAQRRLAAKVKFNRHKGYWYYSINWIDNLGRPHTLDPIISIKPKYPFTGILTALLSLFGLSFFIYAWKLNGKIKTLKMKD
jgi:hypothetical protein